MRTRVVAGIVGGAAAATALVVVLASGSDSSSPRPVKSVVAAPPAPAAPSDPRARLAGLRFLERNADGTVAVIDDAVAKQSYFSKVGDLVLGARVQSITEGEVTLADDKLGVVTLPYRGRGDSGVEIRRPFEARAGHVPVHTAPSVSPEQVAADQAIVDEYLRTLPTGPGRGGGGGIGGGRGRNRDDNKASKELGGRGRQRHRAEREAKEAEAAAAKARAGSADE